MFKFLSKNWIRTSIVTIVLVTPLSIYAQQPLTQQQQPSEVLPENNESLSIERIFSSPSLNGPTTKQLKYSPDGKTINYLKAKAEDAHRYDLWQYDIANNVHKVLVDSDSIFSGKEELSDEEKARRERQRVYGSGIMEYVLSNNGDNILFPINGDVYLYTLSTDKSRRLTLDQAYETDLKFSPKGRYVSFIKNNNIHVIDLKSNTQSRLTKDGSDTIKNGMAEFVAQEEMNRMTGYWWSPNGKYIAFLKVDETPVDTVIRNEIYADNVKLFEQRYPAAGSNNVEISLHTVNVSNSKDTKYDLGKNKDIYIARVSWMPDSKAIAYQIQDRSQQSLKLKIHKFNARSAKTIIEETSDHWVNLNDDFTLLKKSKQFIWASERDGFKHLYLFNYKGELISQLTKGKWVVDQLIAIDEDNGWVYFTGRADTPIEKHLYKVKLDGKAPEHVSRVSKRSGTHKISFAKDNLSYIDNFSSITTPAQVSLHKANGSRITYLLENKLDQSHPSFLFQQDLVIPRYGTIKSDDGKVDLLYKIYTPKVLKPGKKYPVIVRVYGGPHAQRVTNSWGGADMTQYMVDKGYIVFQLDNRGSNYRGTDFEFEIYKQLGKVELDDQISGVKYLHTLPYVDKSRIGIYGHSYGGYMALMAIFNAGEYFKAAVSGAPVTDWLLYDTHYTERYLSHPERNAMGYEKSSVFPYVSNFDDKNNSLFLYHGMADDNVLFTNTTKLIKVMQDENKMFELMTYPGSKHSMRGKKVKTHLNHAIMNFFDRQLK